MMVHHGLQGYLCHTASRHAHCCVPEVLSGLPLDLHHSAAGLVPPAGFHLIV
jgi:hypothetical protein